LMMRFFPIVNYVFPSVRRPEVIVLRTLPRRVREFVLVRWPRTGSPRVWRSPRAERMSFRRLMFCPISRRSSPSIVKDSASARIFCSSSLVSSFPFLAEAMSAVFKISSARAEPIPKMSGREYASCLLSGMVMPAIRI